MNESEQGRSESVLDTVVSSSMDVLSVDNDMANIAFMPCNIFTLGHVL